jgi:hypothetical protein
MKRLLLAGYITLLSLSVGCREPESPPKSPEQVSIEVLLETKRDLVQKSSQNLMGKEYQDAVLREYDLMDPRVLLPHETHRTSKPLWQQVTWAFGDNKGFGVPYETLTNRIDEAIAHSPFINVKEAQDAQEAVLNNLYQ